MKFTYNYLIIILLSLNFQLNTLLMAQNQEREDINRDSQTLYKIIDKLLNKDSVPRHFIPHNTKGVYIPEFGLIFHVQQNPFDRIRIKILNNRLKQIEKLKTSVDTLSMEDKDSFEKIKEMNEKRIKADAKSFLTETDDDFYIVDTAVTEKNFAERKDEIIQNLKNDIYLFYNKYASSLRNLKENDKIALIIDLDHWGDSESNNLFLTSQTSYKVLDKYRKQELKDNDLKNKISYSISTPKGNINSNIEIMNEIINENLNVNQFLHRPLYNNGFYFNDFGVIFFLEIPEYVFGRYNYKNLFSRYMHKDRKPVKTKKADEEENLENKVSNLKDNIFNIIASYGHTLQIHPDEYIIMNIDLGDKVFDLSTEQPSRITMKIRKKYLDDYYHGDLSIKNLQKKFVINSYFP